MLNDYHALRLGKNFCELPDEMVHSVANDVELSMLERKIKPEEIAILYESLRRQEPKVHGVTVTDKTTVIGTLG